MLIAWLINQDLKSNKKLVRLKLILNFSYTIIKHVGTLFEVQKKKKKKKKKNTENVNSRVKN